MKNSRTSIWLMTAVLSTPIWVTVATAQDCTVTNTLDSADGAPLISGSLRLCLTSVRNGDSVLFDPTVFDLVNSDADTTINVLQELPALDDGNVTIEASNRRVSVNGSGANSANGMVVSSDSNQIRGLNIIGFPKSGVVLNNAKSNVIGGNRNTGTGPNGQGLRISANGTFGIEITGAGSDSNVVKGCWIGLDAAGTSHSSNARGVIVRGGAHGNTIGSPVAGETNLISGNTFEGLTISGTGTDSNVVKGNWIGLDKTGETSLTNSYGVLIEAGSQSNTVGGVALGDANVISGNAFEGITVSDAGTDDNVIIGNVIGASAIEDSLGRGSVSNGSAGIFLSKGTQNTKVGGDTSSEGNLVSFNGGNGVELRDTGTRRNSIRGNRITRNARGGIALFDGSNDNVRPPTITSVQNLGASSLGTGSTLRIRGVAPLDGNAEIFNDSGAQGGTLLGKTDVLTGAWTTDVDVSQTLNVTARLTDALGNTSRFGVFGLTNTDSDDDGVSDIIEGMAATAPADPSHFPALTGTITLAKVGIKLNFTKANSDSIKLKMSVDMPPGFDYGSISGVFIAGHSEAFTLDSDLKASTANSKIALKLSSKGNFLLYSIKLAPLHSGLESSGLTDTNADEERWVLPVGITAGGAVSFTTVTVTYKAKQGKSGKAKL